MMGALVYLQFTSTKNRLIARLKRLKKPKYLIGGIVGGLYFYAYFFRFLFIGGRHNPPELSTWFTAENKLLVECGVGLLLFLFAILSWVLPNKRAALTFTEAEIAFLFPAPVTRRTLIQFKLLRSQLAVLFTVLIFTLLSRRAGGNPFVHALAWWLVLSVLNLHFMGVSFLRTMLLDRGITSKARRTIILGGVAVVATVVGVRIWISLPPMETISDPATLLEQARQALTSGPLPIVIYPFRLLVRPYMASDLGGFLTAAWPAFLILLAHYWFVIRADVAFEEASVEASRKIAERMAAARAGKLRGSAKARARRAPFELSPKGSLPIALFWKNLIGAGQMFNKRLLIVLTVVAIAVSVGMTQSGAPTGFMGMLGIFSLMFLIWSILLGPQALSQDLRQDVRMADLIKTYPMKGWEVVLGELLAPVVILTLIQWLLLPLAIGGLVNLDRHAELNKSMVFGFALALFLILPMLNSLSLIIPNASVLLFPAWFQTDKAMPHGIEAMGQRIIMLFGQLLVLLLSMLPAGAVFTLVLLLLKWVAGWLVAAPIAGLATAVVIAVEVTLALMLMGRWFEKLDVSEEGST